MVYAAPDIKPALPIVRSAADRVTVTLYAKWTPNRYTIVYDANGGEGAPEAQSVYADAEYSFNISDKIPTYVSPSGVAYEFLDWSESPDREAALQYSSEGGTQGDAAGTQSVNEAPAVPAPEPVQPEVPAEGEVKHSDTDKTEPPKAEAPESP